MRCRKTPTITTVSINSLEKTKTNPDIDRENVQVLGEVAVQYGSGYRSSTKNKYFCWMRIFGSKTKRCRVFVMKLVDMPVQDTSV